MLSNIRNIEKSDYYLGYIELLNQFRYNQNTISYNQFCEFIDTLSDNHQILVIEHNSKIIATLTILIENKLIHNISKIAHIEDIIIHENYRRKGLGKFLINKALSIAENYKCYKVILASNQENKIFYEKCGFIEKEVEMAKYLKTI